MAFEVSIYFIQVQRISGNEALQEKALARTKKGYLRPMYDTSGLGVSRLLCSKDTCDCVSPTCDTLSGYPYVSKAQFLDASSPL